MADQSDVEAALVTQLSSILYPSGTSAGSVTGSDCRIYRGWPNSAALDTDLRAGIVNVTVFPGPGPGRITTRYLQQWQATQPVPTLTASVSGASVTFAGTAGTGQIAGLRVNGQTYAYVLVDGDTPQSVAANLAALARADVIVLMSSATLTIPGAYALDARVVAQAEALNQIRRQCHALRVTCWCPTPSARDAAAIAIDHGLAQISFLDLSDGTQAHMVYDGTIVFDHSQDALLYRRDLMYTVEYPTILSAVQPAMLWGDLGLGAASFPA